MKKILYISDYTLDQYNSVRDILYNLLVCNIDSYEQTIATTSGIMHEPIKESYYETFRTYSTANQKILSCLKSKDMKFFEKTKFLYYRFLYTVFSLLGLPDKPRNIEHMAYIKTIIKKEKPQLVILLTYNPSRKYTKYLLKHKIPYISVLYDTYIGRPKLNKDKAYKLEKFVAEKSQGYYVPDFFYGLYKKTYHCDKIRRISLPLLIPQKDVLAAYKNKTNDFSFTYFGHIQSFRNMDTVKSLLKQLDIKVDVFSTENYESDDTFKFNNAVTKDELYRVVANSKFLIALDNSFPYQDYLPSKLYLYVSFTKPIIAFGDNELSALKEFLKDYPYFYYQNINEPIDGLVNFLNQDFPETFNLTCYQKYLQYLPESALKPLIENVNNLLN